MSQDKAGPHEQGVEIPYTQINPETLRNLIREFVTRDGSDWGDPGCTLDDKIEQVLKQLKNRQVKVVYDLKSSSANLVAC